MKNTTFRKKALLSSVAMLLVALVALGSATFAWFAADPVVDAAGINMKTTTAAGLVGITSSELTVLGKSLTEAQADGTLWDHDLILNAKSIDGVTKTDPTAFKLNPVSGKGNTKFTTLAANDYESTAKGDNAVTNATINTDFYNEKVYLKSTDNSAVSDVELTGVQITYAEGASSVADSVRIEVIVNGVVKGTYGLKADGSNTYLTQTATTYAGAVSSDKYDYTVAAAQLDEPVSLGGITANNVLTVDVNVYLDGEDATCISRQVNANNLISYLNLTFESASSN